MEDLFVLNLKIHLAVDEYYLQYGKCDSLWSADHSQASPFSLVCALNTKKMSKDEENRIMSRLNDKI